MPIGYVIGLIVEGVIFLALIAAIIAVSVCKPKEAAAPGEGYDMDRSGVEAEAAIGEKPEEATPPEDPKTEA